MADKLTDTAVRNAKAGPKPRKMADGSGLYLIVTPAGGRWWRLKYRFEGKEKLLSLGTYPDVSLKQARQRRDEARKLLTQGVDPSALRKAEKLAPSDTFEALAREWLATREKTWTPRHTEGVVARLERHVFPFIGSKPIREIAAPDLLAVIRRIEAQGIAETARRALQVAGQIFRYAVATGRADRDPSGDLRGTLAPKVERHFSALVDPQAVGGLMRAIEAYEGHFVTRCALRLAPLVFVRPGELRQAEWSEFDLENAEWRIPAAKMKMKEQHIVPLSRQAVEVLGELQALTGDGRHVFPSARTKDRAMSENAVLAALRRMGFTKAEMTGHGFRSTASTILHEQGWPSDVIERQLAHAERNKVKASYNHAQHLPERRKMMQWWADYLDALRTGGQVPAKED